MNCRSCCVLLSGGIFLSGCALFNSPTPRPGSNADDARYLRPIARQIGIACADDRAAVDLATDIRIALDGSIVVVPEPLPDSLVADLSEVLKPADRKKLEQRQDFFRKMKGQRVVALPVK